MSPSQTTDNKCELEELIAEMTAEDPTFPHAMAEAAERARIEYEAYHRNLFTYWWEYDRKHPLRYAKIYLAEKLDLMNRNG